MSEHTINWTGVVGVPPSEPTQLDRIEAQNAEILAIVEKLLERKKPKKSLLTEWILPAYVDEKIWAAFLKHRKEKGQSLQEESYKWCMREMDKIKKAGHDVNAAITKSIANGYTGIFAPRTDKTKPGATEIQTASHDRVDFAKMAQAERELDAVDPYASLK